MCVRSCSEKPDFCVNIANIVKSVQLHSKSAVKLEVGGGQGGTGKWESA